MKDWRGRWGAWRNRLAVSPRFQKHAFANPLLRPMARRRARTVFDLTAGFVYTQILTALVRLELLDPLADHPMTIAEAAAASALPLEGAERLLRGGVAIGLLERRGEAFGLSMAGAVLRAQPGLAAMIRHHALLYEDLRDPVALLRGETDPSMARFWRYIGERDRLNAADVAEYSALMAESQHMVAEQALAAYPPRRHRKLLDIGGGEGVFARAALTAAPDLSATVFDLPAVAERARAAFAEAGLSARADAVGGDFDRTPPPAGADLISLIRVLFDHGDDRALAILRLARAAAGPGATLLIAEPMAEIPGAEAMGDGYFGFYLLAMRGGRPRSPKTLMALACAAGWQRPRWRAPPNPLICGVITARA